MDFLHKKCVPCETKVPPLTRVEAQAYLRDVPGWALKARKNETRGEYLYIERAFEFKDFKEAMVYVNRVAEVAEEEGHHPDIMIHYNKVTLALWTHFIGGLHENDFIMAAKINSLIHT